MNVSDGVALLGKKALDRVTGFTGTVTTVGFDLYGCIQLALTPVVDKDGKIPEGRWFDLNRLKIQKTAAVMQPPRFDAYDAPTVHGPAEKPSR